MNAEKEAKVEDTSAAGLGLRMIWLMAGPMGLPIVIGHMVFNTDGGYTAADVAYAVVVAVMITARFLDVTRYGGTTVDGAPATMTHFSRYALFVGVGSLALWVGAHWLGSLVG